MRYLTILLLLLSGITFGQSKKEIIIELQNRVDSLQDALIERNMEFDRISVKLKSVENKQKIEKTHYTQQIESSLYIVDVLKDELISEKYKLNLFDKNSLDLLSYVDSLKSMLEKKDDNRLLDTKPQSHPGVMDLGEIDGESYFYKRYVSNKYGLNVLTIYKDSIITRGETNIIFEFELNGVPIETFKDSSGRICSNEFKGIAMNDDNTLTLKLQSKDIIFTEILPVLKFERKYYEARALTEFDCTAYLNSSSLKYSDDFFFFINKSNIDSLISDFLTGPYNYNYFDQISYFGKNVLSLNVVEEDAPCDAAGGFNSPPQYESYDLSTRKVITVKDLFSDSNIGIIKKIISSKMLDDSIVCSASLLESMFESIEDQNILIELFGISISFDTRSCEPFWNHYAVVFIPFSDIQHLMSKNKLTERLLNQNIY